MTRRMGAPKQQMSTIERMRLESAIGEALRRGEWSMSLALKLADEFGIHKQAVYKARERVYHRWKEDMKASGGWDQRRETILDRIDYDIQAARKSDPKAPVIGILRKLEAEILGQVGRKIELSGPNGSPLQIQHDDLRAKPTPDLVAEVQQLTEAIEKLKAGNV